MKIAELIRPERIAHNVHSNSKKRALEELSELIARDLSGLTKEEIFDSLIGRERLGSTGLGHGVALPHGRMAGQEAAIGAFIKLDEGVDFDAVDNRPVDLLFALLVPEHFTDEHLNILAQLAEMFANETFCERIRNSENTGEIQDLFSHWEPEKKTASA